MGKAFSEEERERVQEALRRVGLKLLAESGIRNVSIRRLTKEVGIAQGGFYSFYQDKEDFVMDLMCLRVREKTQAMLDKKKETLKNPRDFLVELLYREGMHLKENKAFQNGESGTLEFWSRASKTGENEIRETYLDFLSQLLAYWEKKGLVIECDVKGLMNVGMAAGILFTNADSMEETYFKDVYRTFCEAEVDRFFKVVRK
ncbi:MAG: TetR/AcrR family transcriptional regulator [Lachnospiraceae bacterium]|nr:TetR/AcrR family transcriptional regulator [Lachnospiraceae bacterium]